MVDVITLSGVRATGRHGVLAAERELGQKFVVDARLWLDLSGPALTDDVLQTVDYAQVADIIHAAMTGPPAELIETLAYQILHRLFLLADQITQVQVEVHKPGAPIPHTFEDVSVTLTRTREQWQQLPLVAVPVVLGLGANEADPVAQLQQAVREIAALPGLELVQVSACYDTAPIGGPPQARYTNAVALARTTLGARQLLRGLQRIELDHGRDRSPQAIRWGARPLDVDIITYGHENSDDAELTLPHPRAHERGFVLIPWLNADPQAQLAPHGAVAELVQQLPADQRDVHELPDVQLWPTNPQAT